jgi:hypothetical protein
VLEKIPDPIPGTWAIQEMSKILKQLQDQARAAITEPLAITVSTSYSQIKKHWYSSSKVSRTTKITIDKPHMIKDLTVEVYRLYHPDSKRVANYKKTFYNFPIEIAMTIPKTKTALNALESFKGTATIHLQPGYEWRPQQPSLYYFAQNIFLEPKNSETPFDLKVHPLVAEEGED